MRGFVRRRGRYVAELDATERAILGGVVADVISLLGESVESPAEPDADASAPRRSAEDVLADLSEEVPEPTDPALARLFPAASTDDDEIAGEFRRLTQGDLHTEKVDRLRMVWSALRSPGTKIIVEPDRAMDWAAALTDVRLVLSERLGIRNDSDAEDIYALSAAAGADGDEVQLALASVYSALTWLQESLVQVMLPTLAD